MTDDERGSASASRGAGYRLPRQFGIWLLAAATLAIAGIAVYLAFFTELDDDLGTRGGEDLIVELSGYGEGVIEAFTVEERWEIRWESHGDRFVVHLVGGGDEDERQIITRGGPGGGSTYLNETGTFELRVEADDDWRVRVFEVPRR